MTSISNRESELERTVLAPLRQTSKQFYLVLAGLSLVFLLGAAALANQWWVGLGVTGLSRPVYWGVYITNFVFFIGISHAGTLISAILRVTQAEWRRPITRIAEAITFFALILGMLQVWIDMGRPERILFPFVFGRFQSPFLWDFTCVGVYFMSSMLYLYLPMIPDLARLRDRMTDAPRWRRSLYTVMSFGWHGNAEQHRRLEIAIGIMAIVIIPVAVSVHTVVSWIFGMTMQPMWHSTILGPYFVVGAIFSGIAMLFLFMTLLRRAWHFEQWIGEKQYNYLGILLLVMSAFWGYFTLAEFLTTGYSSVTNEIAVFHAKLLGEFAPEFWTMVTANLVIPFAILTRRKGRSPLGTFIASFSIVVGMWIERFLIVAPSLTHPSLGFMPAVYTPSITEVAITAGSLALFALLFLLFFKLFPAISVWEVEEGEAVEAVRRKAREMAQSEGAQPALRS
ncbi:MAG: polysulfide reductase NrfD [Chloroflexi bacterium]|nr:polysulfide reductase NrfD [Chloroflexota bacterium]